MDTTPPPPPPLATVHGGANGRVLHHHNNTRTSNHPKFSLRSRALAFSVVLIMAVSFMNFSNLTTPTLATYDTVAVSRQEGGGGGAPNSDKRDEKSSTVKDPFHVHSTADSNATLLTTTREQQDAAINNNAKGDSDTVSKVAIENSPKRNISQDADSNATPLTPEEHGAINDGGPGDAAGKNGTSPHKVVEKADLKIVILNVTRLEQLKRMVESLAQAEYDGDSVDLLLQIEESHDVPKETMDWVQSNVVWKQGKFRFELVDPSLRLAHVWSNAWNASNDNAPRAMFFWDSVRVAPVWYMWLKSAYDAYADRTDIAGISLEQRPTDFHPSSSSSLYEPFLHPHCGYTAYAPIPSVWRNFLRFTDHVQKENVGVGAPNGVEASNRTWVDLLIYFANHYNLHTLYYNLPQEKMLISTRDDPSDDSPFFVDETVSISAPFELEVYDFHGETKVTERGRTMVMSGAAGYKLEQYRMFVESLRRVYDGEIHLLLRLEETSSDITEFLEQQHVNVSNTMVKGDPKPGESGWHDFNRQRFHWYKSICTEEYWLCMAVDFRDTMFQLNPFSGLYRFPDTQFFVFEHHLEMNSWHFDLLKQCGHYGIYAQVLKKTKIVNAGGLIGAPAAYQELSSLMTLLDRCNDQVILNVAIYANLLNVSVQAFPQGFGNILNVGYGAPVVLDERRRFYTNESLLAPVVHQYDLVPGPKAQKKKKKIPKR